MRSLWLKSLFVAALFVSTIFGVAANDCTVRYEALARQRAQVLGEKLKLDEVQKEKIYDIYLLYSEKLYREIQSKNAELNSENIMVFMKREAPNAISDIKAMLSKKQRKIYEKDLEAYEVAETQKK